jgi:hypothetical protein
VLLGDVARKRNRTATTSKISIATHRALPEAHGMVPLVGLCHSGLGRLHRSQGAIENGEEHVRISARIQRDIGLTQGSSIPRGSFG